MKKSMKIPAVGSERDNLLKTILFAADALGWNIVMDSEGGWNAKCTGMVIGDKDFVAQFTDDDAAALEVTI